MSSGYSSLEEDAEDFFFTARTSFFRRAPQGKPRAGQQDVEKEKETHNYLSKEEIKEKVHKYNLAVTDKLKMTLNSNGIYTGFIKVQMELCKPTQTSGKLAPGSNGCMNTLHISSTNTVGEVIEALLKKFLVTESPAKFALYKRCHREDQVYACKLSDREHPLYLRLVAGPRTDTLSFVLREHEIGEMTSTPGLGQAEARSQKLHPGLPRGCRGPNTWAIICCFPRPPSGSWIRSGAVGIPAGAHMGCWQCRRRLYPLCYSISSPLLES
ncbi:ras association domain-containing protein 3 isoform X1 [Oryctolagus cuniculus]|uniref:ras association domain-containing protein 3 isoform X1 n=1 Tax=Oryctolagus cuniculus TaxID=9986 RepID=UPI0038792492